jgi:hypothetical protein
MEEFKDYSEEINRRIEEIQTKVLSGEIVLLDTELVSIFENLKNSLNIDNLNRYSSVYKNAFHLLIQKFEELKILINNIDRKEGFLKFLRLKPPDSEINNLLSGCWVKPFNTESLSFNFLESAKEKLNIKKGNPATIDQVEKMEVKGTFLLEISEQKFTEKMSEFYNRIKNQLPCGFEDIFESEQDQIKIYENFVYLLHLLQLGKIKYQKETNFLYL